MRQIAIPAGLIAAATGIRMTLTYDLPATDSAMLNAIRLVVVRRCWPNCSSASAPSSGAITSPIAPG